MPAWVWVSGVVLLIGGIGGWGIWRTLRPPPKIDVSATIADAQATARARFSDAVLASISAKYVDPSGIDDLAHNGRVEYRFVSPSRAALPPAATTVGLPHDNSQDPVCGVEIEFRVFMQGAGSATNDLRGGACTVPLAHPPSCTVAQVWAEAIRRGAPNNAIATYLRLEPNDRGEPTWTLEVDPVFRGELPDRCPFPQR